ncbi:uncharacterized protein LOC128551213 isoform X1 [Mercenaria mercenaria]|uniref:uncharacterized protein LOC128551213 isoform X1 n=1 Tax=Mercenaria mercenaria TaxID=6596 RepID=UPI00234E5B4D|nr:uncharacterized protein LOC128551213 isoform X1 [Mercenaria mercenaria]
MAYIWSRDVWILLYILAVQNVAQIVPKTEDGKISFERRFLLDQTSSASNISLEQFASCYLTCVSGFEKLAETCCKTGIDAVCLNLPWNLLKPRLGSCPGLLVTPAPAVWTSLEQFAACSLTCVPGYEKLTEVCCQTGMDVVCSNLPWALLKNHLGTCHDTCQDDVNGIGCGDQYTLREVCKEKTMAWSLGRRSCGLCDTCWDYLNCTTHGAQTLFCGREEYAIQYCRKTCGKCDHNPVDVQHNRCGDPVASELVCELLQTEICVCNDPDVRPICRNYCDNKCAHHPFAGSNCIPARRKRRDAFLSQVLLH